MPKGLKSNFIPVNQPAISMRARAYVEECLQSGWISSAGPFVERFERAWAEYVGAKHGVAVSSGTAALHCALAALGIGKGDEVIVPAFTMISPIFAVLYVGATPVFVDCERETFTIDSGEIERAITPRTKAILAVHIFGHPCEMDAITRIARQRELKVVEDAAEAHGGLYKGRRCGSLADVSCFSFYANKIVTSGEGGMVMTSEDRLAERARKFRDLWHSEGRRFIHQELGYNYRLTNLQAALGLGELESIDEHIARKLAIAGRYTRGLSGIPGLRTPVTRRDVRNVFWMYGILIDPEKFGLDKDTLRTRLLALGIDSRDFFYPPADQPALVKALGPIADFPNARYLARHGCYLPSGLGTTDEEVDRVIEAVRSLAP